MKKGLIFITVLIITLATLVTSYFISNTYAKYTETFDEVSSTAKIAKWSFNVENPVSLFDASSIKAYDGTISGDKLQECVMNNIAPENCVFAGTKTNDAVSTGYIAPGTSGEYKFKIQNNSDVAFRVADVKVTGTDGTEGRIWFCLDGFTCAKGIDGLNQLLASKFNSTSASIRGKANGSIYDAVHTLWWYWAFDENDSADLAIGKKAKEQAGTNPLQVNMNVTITLEQAM